MYTFHKPFQSSEYPFSVFQLWAQRIVFPWSFHWGSKTIPEMFYSKYTAKIVATAKSDEFEYLAVAELSVLVSQTHRLQTFTSWLFFSPITRWQTIFCLLKPIFLTRALMTSDKFIVSEDTVLGLYSSVFRRIARSSSTKLRTFVASNLHFSSGESWYVFSYRTRGTRTFWASFCVESFLATWDQTDPFRENALGLLEATLVSEMVPSPVESWPSPLFCETAEGSRTIFNSFLANILLRFQLKAMLNLPSAINFQL